MISVSWNMLSRRLKIIAFDFDLKISMKNILVIQAYLSKKYLTLMFFFYPKLNDIVS